jgi:hypothetical protein
MAADKKKLFVQATQDIKAGKFGEASKVLKELMTLDPANIEYRRLSASLNLKLGNMISAKAVYESLVEEATQMRDARLTESLLREYLAAAPRYVPFIEKLGQALEDDGKNMLAANEYAKALQILLEDMDSEQAGRMVDLQSKIKTLAPNHPVLAQYETTKSGKYQAAPAASPLAAAIKISAPAPPPPHQDAPPMVQDDLSDVLSKPIPKRPPPPPKPATPAPPPMVEDDLTELLSKPIPKRQPPPKRELPPAPPPPPMVEDDLTDLLSRPIPKRAPLPIRETPPPPPAPPVEEKPSLTKALFGFLQSSPAPEPAPPPPAPPAPEPPPVAAAPPPVETPAPAAPPQWKAWQPEEPAPAAAPAPVSEPAPAAPAAEWKPWTPPTETTPEPPSTPAEAPPPARSAPTITIPTFGGTPSMSGGDSSAVVAAARERKSAPAALPRQMSGRRSGGIGAALRPVVTLVGVAGGGAAALFVALAVGCLVMEKSPSDAYRNFTGSPPALAQDPRKNAWLLLIGFDADAGRDPMTEGLERAQKPAGVQAIQCAWEGGSASMMRLPEETAVVETWWQGLDPAGQFQKEAARIQEWTAGNPVVLERYRRWLGLPFEDNGYGAFAAPNCSLILAAHRLHVAEGFGQGLPRGIDRLQDDLTAWRKALAQARTLSMKQLAMTILGDDLTLLAGVFARPDVTGDTVSDLARLTKPLEQVERSLRWPMQNALAVDTKLLGSHALFSAVQEPSPLERVLMWLPLPKQRALNAYTDHFEALIKAADQPLTSPPKLYEFAKTPAQTVMDYVTNPIDNLVPGRTTIAWDQQVGAMNELDARLRLAGLAALLRGVPRKAIPGRIAEAGSKYTDPFTELPMLLNPAQGRIYSIGKNRKDDDGDARLDVSIAWSFTEPPKDVPRGKTR